MLEQKIATKNECSCIYRPLQSFTINRQRDIQHLASVKRLEMAPKDLSRRVAEVNKFGMSRLKQATHVSGRRKRGRQYLGAPVKFLAP